MKIWGFVVGKLKIEGFYVRKLILFNVFIEEPVRRSLQGEKSDLSF